MKSLIELPHDAVRALDSESEAGAPTIGVTADRDGACAGDIKDMIEAALVRTAELDASQIVVEAVGGRVILRGTVRSWAEHEDAINAASAAPGVVAVEDHLSIRP